MNFDNNVKKRGKSTTRSSEIWGQRGTAGVSFAAGLTFEGVDVRIGDNLILNKLDLTLTPGEIVCLLGESGSGKSTILRVAAGIQPVDAGEVRINDQIVSSTQIQVPPEQRGIGLMFQDFALFPHLSLLENVAFGLADLGRKQARQQALTALTRVGLQGREHDFPHMLSGGQQQRLALARTIAPRPGIIMLDEPFSGLDARMRESVRTETLAVLRETHATSLIVTHDPEEAMLLGDRMALLRHGKIVQIDDVATVYAAPVDLAAARFLAPLSEISAEVNNGKASTPLGDVLTPGRANGTKVVIGVRAVGAVEMSRKKPGIPGRIVTKWHALGVDICEVLVAGIAAPIKVRQRANAQHNVGDDIFLRLISEHVLVFDAN